MEKKSKKLISLSRLNSFREESKYNNNNLLTEQNRKLFPIYYHPKKSNENIIRLANYSILKEQLRISTSGNKEILYSSLNSTERNFSNNKQISTNFSKYISQSNVITNIKNSSISYKKINTISKTFYSNNSKSSNKKKNTFSKTFYSNYSKTTNNNDQIISLFKNKTLSRKKYPFIIINHPILPSNFTKLPKEILDENKKLHETLQKDNMKVFQDSFYVVSKYKFSPQFRNPFQERIIMKDKNEILEDKKNIKKDYEYKAFKALSIINLAKNIKLKKEDKKIKKNEILSVFKRIIIKAANHFKRLTIDLNELFYNYPKQKKDPIKYKNYFNHLITFIKNKDIEKANIYLDTFKCLVLDYDINKQTLLHWVVKRNIYQLIPKIVSYGANVDFLDKVGFSPLHLAINFNKFESVVFLFLYYASPFIKDKYGKKPIDYCKNYKMKILCKRAILLHIIHIFGGHQKFYENVKRGFAFFVESEFKHELDCEAYKYITDMANEFRKQMFINR